MRPSTKGLSRKSVALQSVISFVDGLHLILAFGIGDWDSRLPWSNGRKP
jgi:hypothetical protein